MGRKHDVRELLQPSVLVRGFDRFEGIDKNDLEYSGSYTLQRMFEEPDDLATYIEKLKLILRNAKKAGFERVDLDITYHDDYDGPDLDVTMYGWRPETRDERLQRLRTARKRSKAAKEAAAERKKRQAAKERADYERLKKKFEGKK
jgi:hypothetical protein